MNIKQKILGLPLIYLMIIGIASATIVGIIIYTSVTGIGTYTDQGSPVKPIQYVVSDGDTTDNITFSQSGNVVQLNFPLWKGTDNVEYRYALKIVPDVAGRLILERIQRSGNGITFMGIEMEPSLTPFTYPYPVPIPPQTNAFSINLNASQPAYVSFIVSTNNSAAIGSTDTLYFDISLQ